jgi:hypothetical protein
MASEPEMALGLYVWIKFYWNTATPTHLHTANGCFHGTRTELSGHDRDHMTLEAYNIPGLT